MLNLYNGALLNMSVFSLYNARIKIHVGLHKLSSLSRLFSGMAAEPDAITAQIYK